MLETGGRERAVAAVAVESHVVRFGGERSERADRVLNGREALGWAGPRTPPERVVTACVKKDQVDALLGLHLRKHLGDVDAGGLDGGGALGPKVSAFDSRVDRNEPVHAVDLDAVAGVEEEPGARLVQLAGEFGYLFVHPALVKVFRTTPGAAFSCSRRRIALI